MVVFVDLLLLFPFCAAAQDQHPDGAPAASTQAPAMQSPAPARQAEIQKTIEAYLRNLFAWDSDFGIKVGAFTDAPLPGFYEVLFEVSFHDQTEKGSVYVTRDGRFMFRGEIHDLAADPFAANRANLHVGGSPTKGPADAKVTIFEFSDFECPHCKTFAAQMKTLDPELSQVRFVFKNFPLASHTWAMSAAIAARCVHQQDPEAFWKLHDALFENQASINADNAPDRLQALALQAGAKLEPYKTCISSPEAKAAVEGDIAEAHTVNVDATPTIFVDGRPIIGGDPDLLQHYRHYEHPPAH
jgi:protein-disulfide isomerase